MAQASMNSPTVEDGDPAEAEETAANPRKNKRIHGKNMLKVGNERSRKHRRQEEDSVPAVRDSKDSIAVQEQDGLRNLPKANQSRLEEARAKFRAITAAREMHAVNRSDGSPVVKEASELQVVNETDDAHLSQTGDGEENDVDDPDGADGSPEDGMIDDVEQSETSDFQEKHMSLPPGWSPQIGMRNPRAPVTPLVVERHVGKLCRVGFAEMNGWRSSMEDAHIIHMQDSWGFFGVLDGHGGSQCSTFIQQRLTEELTKKGAPKDDDEMKELILRLDAEFLGSHSVSGSTCTFVIVTPPSEAGGSYQLRVGNVGDSRVLLGSADGEIIPGSGTDGALTLDHKPDDPVEKLRIAQAGGEVTTVMGVQRVNGDLCLSRAFGDERYKRGGSGPESHQVIAVPDFKTLECKPTDFLMLVCDGISEQESFPNSEVVRSAAAQMQSSSSARLIRGQNHTTDPSPFKEKGNRKIKENV
eukprot:gnl/TRDRNA2_/TRDRNA2_150684_c1_seq2.p1 gnl/TRDRNA2_/TRDRNA2_150684_c1~~gnl/TRDRNA2_/TRDRNA2_150684_c1_seq2.p1  ORF type:complete len:471 (-),score=89.14 gnl/TRDRNA2_/TRDRNA2_150684_c1_seq2:23-1435(-)